MVREPGAQLRRLRSSAQAGGATTVLQDRVVLYLKFLVAVFSVFTFMSVFRIALLLNTDAAERAGVPEQAQVGFGGTVAVVGLSAVTVLLLSLWAFLARSRSARQVQWVDVLATVATGAFSSLLVPSLPAELDGTPLMFALILVLLIRTAVVPSSGLRTLAVGLAAAAPLAGMLSWTTLSFDPEITPIRRFMGPLAAIWSVIFALATMAVSRVIYGLHDQVRTLGSYQLQHRIGSGGMGEVWVATHNMLARPAAVKLIRTSAEAGSSPESLERFGKEAQATAALTCPNTVKIYDFGKSEDGSFYYVMELLDGVDLQTLVEEQGPQPAGRVMHILEQVCRSLSEAHDSGLVHRDIKPANLMLCRYGGQFDFVKVLDFGLVKQHGPSAQVDVDLTNAGVAVGTPAFMAPEMAQGLDVDGQADLYALGCVAYWLLSGTRVFDAPTPVAMLVKHASEEPVPPSQRTELQIPAVLEELVMACLAKSPGDRPLNAMAVRNALEAMPESREWNEQVAAQWWRTHRPRST